LDQIGSLSAGILGASNSPELSRYVSKHSGNPDEPNIAKAIKFTEDASELISEVAKEDFRGSIKNIAKAATKFAESPVFRNLVDAMQRGGRFLTALRSGNLTQTLELMHSRLGYSQGVAQVIERGMHLSNAGSFVIKSLIGRDFERPIAQMTRKAQSKTEAGKEIAEAQSIFGAASTFFYALTDVEHLDTLWQFHRQLNSLKDEVLIESSIRQFEKEAQTLAAEPDLKKQILNEFAAFQQDRARKSKA
jgi:hypothetical protein